MLGIDIVEVDRAGNFVGNDKLLSRMLHPLELEEYNQLANKRAHFIAKRIAVKEAYWKAVGTGLKNMSGWTEVWVEHNEYGAPILKNTHGRDGKVSISDTDSWACAVVLLNKG